MQKNDIEESLTSVEEKLKTSKEILITSQSNAVAYIKKIYQLCEAANVEFIDEFFPFARLLFDLNKPPKSKRNTLTIKPKLSNKNSKAYIVYRTIKSSQVPLSLTEIVERTGVKYNTVAQYLSKYNCYKKDGGGYVVVEN